MPFAKKMRVTKLPSVVGKLNRNNNKKISLKIEVNTKIWVINIEPRTAAKNKMLIFQVISEYSLYSGFFAFFSIFIIVFDILKQKYKALGMVIIMQAKNQAFLKLLNNE